MLLWISGESVREKVCFSSDMSGLDVVGSQLLHDPEYPGVLDVAEIHIEVVHASLGVSEDFHQGGIPGEVSQLSDSIVNGQCLKLDC